MSSWSLGDMMNKIVGYDDTLKAAGYTVTDKGGTKAWSIRHEHVNGTAVEVRNSEWTFISKEGIETVGMQVDELRRHFYTNMDKEELVALLLTKK